MVEWHLSNIQSIVAIPYMEISNWRTKQSSDQSLKYSMSGDVSLEEATAPCFLTELHIALVFVQPVHYRCDQWASIWHFSWVSVYDGSLVEACYFRYACQKNFLHAFVLNWLETAKMTTVLYFTILPYHEACSTSTVQLQNIESISLFQFLLHKQYFLHSIVALCQIAIMLVQQNKTLALGKF